MSNINPDHYKTGSVECIEAIKAQLTDEQFAGYLRGNIVKYVWRYENKGGIEDLRKADWYLSRLIKESENEKSKPTIKQPQALRYTCTTSS